MFIENCIIVLHYVAAICFLFAACSILSDFVLPRIPGFDEWADKFPAAHYDDDDWQEGIITNANEESVYYEKPKRRSRKH